MIKNGVVQYFVEGDCEEKLLNVLKTDMQLIVPGKVQKLNVVQEAISKARLMTLRDKTTVVLIFDVDVKKEETLYKNIELLEQSSKVRQIICIPQVENLEDELMKACEIGKITDLTASSTTREFKSDFIKMNNLKSKLEKYNFDISKMWSSDHWEGFARVHNESSKIKIKYRK